MAFRKLDTRFWVDVDLEEWSYIQKYFYLYLISNPSTNQIGVYEFSYKQASLHTGIDIDEVYELVRFFEKEKKIKTSSKTKEIVLVNFYEHNKSGSPKVVKHCEDLIEKIKDKSLLKQISGFDLIEEDDSKEEVEIVYPYDTDTFRLSWSNWKEYKLKEFRFKFKSIQSEQASLKKLNDISKNEKEAVGIIETSMANKWKGFWKTENNEKKDVGTIATAILEKRGLF